MRSIRLNIKYKGKSDWIAIDRVERVISLQGETDEQKKTDTLSKTNL